MLQRVQQPLSRTVRITRYRKVSAWIYACTFLLLAATNVAAQTGKYVPGPANLDTAAFANVYFLRDEPDAFPTAWIGVIMNDDQGICVKVLSNKIYRMRTMHYGTTTFYTRVGTFVNSETLDLAPGKNYYIALWPEQQKPPKIAIKMKILDETAALQRIRNHPYPVEDRHCILPFPLELHEYVQNKWPDTLHWIASKRYSYFFVPAPSLEVIVRSKERTALVFRNNLISTTYSEAGGIQYHSGINFTGEPAFLEYCDQTFPPTTLDRKLDTLKAIAVREVSLPEGITYARMVTIENTSSHRNNPAFRKPLHIIAAYIIFYWKDDKGRGHTAALLESERGFAEELHPRAELEERLLRTWASFRVVKHRHK